MGLPASDTPEEAAAGSGVGLDRVVEIVKGERLWRFVCAGGNEADLLTAVIDLAENEESSFDWFDAALVSHEFGRTLNGSEPPSHFPGTVCQMS